VRLTRQAVHDLVQAGSPLRAADVLLFLALNFWQPAVAGALALRGFTRRRGRPGARGTAGRQSPEPSVE
jgi:hypothetical protein